MFIERMWIGCIQRQATSKACRQVRVGQVEAAEADTCSSTILHCVNCLRCIEADLSQRLNTEQRGDSTKEQATPRARTSASTYAA